MVPSWLIDFLIDFIIACGLVALAIAALAACIPLGGFLVWIVASIVEAVNRLLHGGKKMILLAIVVWVLLTVGLLLLTESTVLTLVALFGGLGLVPLYLNRSTGSANEPPKRKIKWKNVGISLIVFLAFTLGGIIIWQLDGSPLWVIGGFLYGLLMTLLTLAFLGFRAKQEATKPQAVKKHT